MKLYKIRDWEKHYENSRSRSVRALDWVPISNKHDGDNYCLIVTHPDGATIFAAFVLMVEVASKCVPRGTLIRSNGKPHDNASLAVATRAPVKWFQTALPWLEQNTDWLEFKEWQPGVSHAATGKQGERHDNDGWLPVNPVAAACHPPDAHIPSLQEWTDYCQTIGLGADWKIKDEYDRQQADGWRTTRADWKAHARRTRTFWESDGRPMQRISRINPPKPKAPPVDYQAGF